MTTVVIIIIIIIIIIIHCRYPIIFLYTAGTGMDKELSMVTGDDHGYFNVWGYAEDDRTAFGWFTPSAKYFFEFAKEDLVRKSKQTITNPPRNKETNISTDTQTRRHTDTQTHAH